MLKHVGQSLRDFFFFFVIGKSYLDYGLLNVEFWTTYSSSFLTNQSRSSIPIRKC